MLGRKAYIIDKKIVGAAVKYLTDHKIVLIILYLTDQKSSFNDRTLFIELNNINC
jgi:hypothetical protein